MPIVYTCNALVHVIYSVISGQYLHTIHVIQLGSHKRQQFFPSNFFLSFTIQQSGGIKRFLLKTVKFRCSTHSITRQVHLYSNPK